MSLVTSASVSTDGTNTTPGSASSFVNGPMSRTGTTAFTFPVGNVSGKNSVWAPVGIAAAALSTITAQYFYQTPANSYNSCDPSVLYHASEAEYWILSSTNATPAVTLNWENSSRSGIIVPSDIVAAQYNGSCWTSLGGVGIPNGITGYVTGSGFTSNKPITFGTKNGNNPLPIELLRFDATCGSNGVDLSWTTATELNNDHFTIERSSDVTNWQVAKTVKGAGNSNMIMNYSITDENSLQGVTYYRLKQTDFDGKSETFSPVSVSCSIGANQASVSYYPNPFATDLTVDVKNISSDNGIVNIFDLSGNKIYSKTINRDELESQTFSMNLSNLATGIYTIVFQTDTFSAFRKIVKN